MPITGKLYGTRRISRRINSNGCRMRASYIIVTSTLLSYKILSSDDTMQFSVYTMLNARAYICAIHAGRIAVESLRLIYFDVAKKNICVHMFDRCHI